MREVYCGKRSFGGHCDHNGVCCWCGESKTPEHGPFVPLDFTPWQGRGTLKPQWEVYTTPGMLPGAIPMATPNTTPAWPNATTGGGLLQNDGFVPGCHNW